MIDVMQYSRIFHSRQFKYFKWFGNCSLLWQLQSWSKPLGTLVLTECENARGDIMSLSRALKKIAKVIGRDYFYCPPLPQAMLMVIKTT